ncbi:MAG TPA: dehydrogenase [Planctomycetaceae bacterium]|nr:dehydrogenase [Planctomycetaceae bacterium]
MKIRLSACVLTRSLAILFLLAGFACQQTPTVNAESPAGFKPIFNGKDLSGWSGDESFWKVVDGTIVAESTEEHPCKENTFLKWSAGEVDDFELKLQFRISGSESANSGIQFRSQVEPDGHVVGYQADMDLAGKWLGCLYDEKGRGLLAERGNSVTVSGPKERDKKSFASADELLKAVNLNEWNSYQITARGKELTLAINGKKTAHVIDTDKENREFSGVLALQLHSGPPMKVEFRDIQLKRLPLENKQKIVFIAGSKSHGYFSHEHNAGCLLLADALNKSGLPLETAVYLNGWPTDVTAFDNADTVVCYCDGGGRHFLNNHIEEFDKVMEQGVGLVCLHYGVETVIGKEGDHFIKWMGGYFEPNWSVNPHWTAQFDEFPDHPITQGVQPFEINDEWYYHMRFAEGMKGVTPILTDMPPRETLNRPDGAHSGNPHVRDAVLVRKEPQHVAWAYDRANNGRGFGFTGGHFHKNWQHDDFRKLVLNAICWTAHVEIPETGVPSSTPTVEELEKNQDYEKPANFKLDPVQTTSKKKSEPSGKTVKTPLFSSPLVTANTEGHAVKVDVPITGAEFLYLVVSDGGNGFSCDWADWVEPRLTGPGGELKLTDLNWISAESEWGDVRKNGNAGGGELKVAGQPVAYGFGTHANSVIGFQLPENHKYENFQAFGGLDNGGTDQGGGQTSVRFHVFNGKPDPAFLAANRSAPAAGGGTASHELDDAISQLDVADGLQASVFAGEPFMYNPTNMDIDHRGRVWICEVINYRQFRNTDSAERVEGDQILILEDTDGDGKADKKTSFYQGRDIDSAHGVCVLGNKVIVSAGENVFVLTDEDGDDHADKKEILFTGISGTQHDHGIHAFVFGPDGKLYFNFGNAGKQIKDKNGQPIVDKQGNVVDDSRKPYQEGMIFRCNLDGSEFETLAWNFRNNWEVCVDSFGTMWQSDNDDDGNRGVRINYVMEYGNYGYKDEFTGAGWRDPRTGWSEEIPLRHWHLNDPGVMPNLLQTGAGSPTGILIYEGNLLPKVFHNEVIHCDAGPNIVRAYPATVDGAGYTAEMVNILEGTRDNWFRPSDVCVAPDGSLFVSDWYDPGVGGHRMADVEHGRVFRLAPPENQYKIAVIEYQSVNGAIEALQSPNQATRYLGWQTLQTAGPKAESALAKMMASNVPQYRARALWALGKLPIDKSSKLKYLEQAMQDDNPDLRITAIRLMRQLQGEINKQDLVDLLNIFDDSPAVRREMLIGLRDTHLPESAQYWTDLATQYDGKDRWYLEALGIAAEKHWNEYLANWLDRVGSNWNSDAGRDIIWRSRADQTASLLLKIIEDPSTRVEELPRYFRSLDFCPTVPQDELAKVAFSKHGEAGRTDLIVSESIARLKNLNFEAHPEYKQALNELLASQSESQSFLTIVDRFNLEEQYPELVNIATKHSGEQLGIDAARILLNKKQAKLLLDGLRNQKPQDAAALARALGQTQENSASGPLQTVMTDDDVNTSVRRAAASALGYTRKGTVDVMKYAQSGKAPGSLKQAIAAVMHASTYKDVKEVANELFPLPPSKDSKPLPPLSELANRKGDVKAGRVVFHTTGTCAKCHQVNGQGKEIGPDLSEIGKKLSKQAMFESILYPSAGVSHSYETYTAVTFDGNIINGLLISQTDEEISLKNADGFVKTIPTDDVDELVKQDISLMPADLQKVMSEEELVNVVEYMMTLKKKQ